MVEYRREFGRFRKSIWVAFALLLVLSFSLQNVAGSAYYSLVMQPSTMVTAPPVILQEGTAGTSTIYANSTSALVSVAPDVKDYVDNNISNVDSSDDKGTHSNFTAQKSGPDAIYDTLTEGDYGGKVNDSENFVDNNTSDVDSHTGHGTHSSFPAMQAGPDSTFDTLTEANTAGGTSTVFTSGFEEGPWDSKWNDNGVTGWSRGTSSVPGSPWAPQSGTNMSYTNTLNLVYLTSDNIGLSGASTASIGFWYMNDDNEADDFLLYFYNGSTYNLIYDLGSVDPEDTWLYYSTTVNNQYLVSNFRIQFWADADGAAGAEKAFVDDVMVNKPLANNYELDLEFQWTTADFDETSEYLCIYTGTMNAEALKVDVWTGSWTNIIASLSANQWNNISIGTYLTGATITFRFLGGTETGDTSQSSWQIDCAIIHVWSTISNYKLDLEVQWTSADFDETNEELCIHGGTMGAENIKVDVWNGSDWENLFTDLNSGWNNVSVTSYLTASNFTIRFKGSVETGDTTPDTWQIDATLLHIWTEDFNYVLKMVENHGSNWKVRLKAYDNSSLTRLDNCSIYIYDGSNSTQIVILNGLYQNKTGPWYDLNASDTEYIWMHVEASSAGTCYIYTYLEILVPTTTTYARYIITFKIT